MPRSAKKFAAQGQEFEITMLGGLEASDFWLRICHVAVDVLKELGQHDTADNSALLAGASVLIKGLDRQTFADLRNAFMKTSTYRSGADAWPKLTDTNFDELFAGQPLMMSQWFGECMLFNFAGFLAGNSGGLGMLEKLQATAATAFKSTSPKT